MNFGRCESITRVHSFPSSFLHVKEIMLRNKIQNLIPERVRARDTHIRESWVRAMEARLVRDELQKCQRIEGVNHYENCKDLAEKYLGMLKRTQK